jgi:uncharacterized membrane protein
MNQATYLATLRGALHGMPAADVADIVRDCERYFLDGAQDGRAEADIALALGDPRRMALELRATAHVAAFENKRTVANLLRLVPALTGLLSFNLVMALPALILGLLLLSGYLASAGAAVSGLMVMASGVTGVERVALSPQRQVVFQSADAPLAPDWSSIDIGNFSVQVTLPESAGPGRAVFYLFNIDLGSMPHWPSSLRPLYGLGLLALALGLWRASGRAGRALLRALVHHVRFNRRLLMHADQR